MAHAIQMCLFAAQHIALASGAVGGCQMEHGIDLVADGLSHAGRIGQIAADRAQAVE